MHSDHGWTNNSPPHYRWVALPQTRVAACMAGCPTVMWWTVVGPLTVIVGLYLTRSELLPKHFNRKLRCLSVGKCQVDSKGQMVSSFQGSIRINDTDLMAIQIDVSEADQLSIFLLIVEGDFSYRGRLLGAFLTTWKRLVILLVTIQFPCLNVQG